MPNHKNGVPIYKICYYPLPDSWVYIYMYFAQIVILTTYSLSQKPIKQLISKKSSMCYLVVGYVAILILIFFLYSLDKLDEEINDVENKIEPFIKRQVSEFLRNILSAIFYIFMFKLKLVQIQMDSIHDTVDNTMLKIKGF